MARNLYLTELICVFANNFCEHMLIYNDNDPKSNNDDLHSWRCGPVPLHSHFQNLDLWLRDLYHLLLRWLLEPCKRIDSANN